MKYLTSYRKIKIQEVNDFVQKVSDFAVGTAGVYGIPRSGTILSAMISITSGAPMLAAPCKGCIVVDDDMVSGKSIAPYLGLYDIAVLCAQKPENTRNEASLCKYVGIWLDEKIPVFPWQIEEWEKM